MELQGTILASELIKMLQDKCKDGDLPVEFYSYEWTDDLEELNWQHRDFVSVKKHKGIIKIYVERQNGGN